MTASYRETDRFIELYFSEIPDEILRESLKVCGWRWYRPCKCWRNFRNPENMIFAKDLCESLNPKTQSALLDLPKCTLSEQTIIVRDTGFYCNAHHIVKDLAGEVVICDRQGNLYRYLFPIVFCISCKIFYVLEDTYLELRKHGVIMCQIMSRKQYTESLSVNYPQNMILRNESFLKVLGYTVSTTQDLSEKQRRTILERAIDSGVLSKDRVLSYLDFFVRQHPQYPDAIKKWKADRDYISTYKLNSKPRIIVKTFVLE